MSTSSFKTDYSLLLPSYSVGAGCYREIENVVKNYGRRGGEEGGKRRRTPRGRSRPERQQERKGSQLNKKRR